MRTGLEALTKAGCRVCSVHPMFGPDEIGLSGRHILFVDTGNPQALSEARALFAHTAAECVDLSLEEHDEVMAWAAGRTDTLVLLTADHETGGMRFATPENWREALPEALDKQRLTHVEFLGLVKGWRKAQTLSGRRSERPTTRA